jgi:hypothetical protein
MVTVQPKKPFRQNNGNTKGIPILSQGDVLFAKRLFLLQPLRPLKQDAATYLRSIALL